VVPFTAICSALIREPCAEFLGVALLIVLGAGVNCQVTLSSDPRVADSQKGDHLSINLGWAAGLCLGVWVSAGISGGHINPAVTLALATWRDFPWKKVPGYIFAQVLGGFTGAALVYGNYVSAIDVFENGKGIRTMRTAGLFATYALDYMTNVSCFFSEVLATAVLMIVILAMTDKKNCPPPAGLFPLVIFIVFMGIGISLGMETGYSLNPARDLGPRFLTAVAGYPSTIWSYRSMYWLWCPVLGPVLGAQLGTLFYDTFLYTGEEGLLSRRLTRGSVLLMKSSAPRQSTGGESEV